MAELHPDIESVILSEDDIKQIVGRLGKEVSRDYEGKNPLVVAVLRGAFVFTADLLRQITVPCAVDFMAVSSYGAGVKSSGVVKILKDLDTEIQGRDILIAEDAALDPDITTSRRWIRFTPEYLDLVTEHEAKEIPLDAIPGPAIELDLLVLAALYTPDDRRLVIPAAALGELLPGGKWTIKTSRYLQAAKHLNSTQGKWVFAFESRSLIVTPAGIDPDRKGLVMRVY